MRSRPSPSGLRSALLCALGVPALASVLDAGQVVHQVTIPHQSVPWNQTVQLPRFDPDLGFLREVYVGVSGAISGSVGLENTNATPLPPQFGTPSAGVRLQPTLPFGSLAAANPAYEGPIPALSAYDGVTDFAGSSGTTLTFLDATGTGSPSTFTVLIAPSGLAAYTGAAGNPGTVSITVDAVEQTPPPPPGVERSITVTAEAHVEIRYQFDALPTTFCSPVNFSGVSCPCNNYGLPPRGCANSSNAQGALLSVGGQASLANDTLALVAQGMPDRTALYVQATGFTYGGFAFGDGLNCIAGGVVRLATQTNTGGGSQYPGQGDTSISVRGAIGGPGETRYYQVLYQDSGAGFCPGSTFNLTNAVAVLWQL